VAHAILQHTRSIAPLVAVQPIYMHPYAVAKMVATLSALYQRRIYLNMVAGGFKNDLTALDDRTPHDRRYARLAEYTALVTGLCEGAAPVSRQGEFYSVEALALSPALPAALQPGIFVSGSSEAGLAAARTLGATAIRYPKPAHDEVSPAECGVACGIRVGIVARAREGDAWDAAHARFPPTRRGQLTRQLAARTSDSVWHRQLADAAATSTNSTYWLHPFESYQTMCPYLVGTYGQVAAELNKYIVRGYRTIILDVPPSADELGHTLVALAAATAAVA
jgi:alkanesulfonate monooxygenase